MRSRKEIRASELRAWLREITDNATKPLPGHPSLIVGRAGDEFQLWDLPPLARKRRCVSAGDLEEIALEIESQPGEPCRGCGETPAVMGVASFDGELCWQCRHPLPTEGKPNTTTTPREGQGERR